MEYTEVLAARHSVRTFSDREIDRQLLDRIVEEAGLAPSSKNSRSTGFMIVQDPSLLEALSQMRTSGSGLIKGAAAAIIVLGDADKTDLWVENCSIRATYLLLSAANYGLGACWVHINGRLRDKNNPDSGNAQDYVRELLGIRDNMKPLCAIALGYEE